MADLNKKYQTILNELAQKIQNPSELEFVKEKMNELIIEYMSSIDRILEIEKNQAKLENKVQKIQRELSMIEEDIYVNDDYEDDDFLCDQMHDNDCEFEITCPYCGFEFLTDESYKSETEIKCPQCHEMIELDWKEEKCSGECQSCGSQCYATNSANNAQNGTIKVEEDPNNTQTNTDSAQTSRNNNQTNNEQTNGNNSSQQTPNVQGNSENQGIDYANNNVNQLLQNKEKNNNEDDM